MDNFSISERQFLENLNSEKMETRIGAVAFVGILLIFGFIGNLHVLAVFAFRMQPSNNRTFILCLAVVDIIACIIGMPFTIVILLHPLTFYDAIECKIVLNVNYFSCACSGLLLVVITVDRYRKICHPMGWQLSQKMAKFVCLLTITGSVGLTLPSFFIFGHNTVRTKYRNITGVQCSTDDEFVRTNYPTIFNLALMGLAITAFISFAVLYTLINRVIWNRGRQTLRKINSVHNEVRNGNNSISEVTASKTHALSDGSPRACLNDFAAIDKCVKAKINLNMTNQASIYKDTRRMTIIFFIIIAVYFCSYIPSLILRIIVFIKYDCFQNLAKSDDIVFHIFNWFFFVNNVANPVVYIFLDLKFRTELKLFYGRCINKF